MASPSDLKGHTNISVAAGTSNVSAPSGPSNFLVSAPRESVSNYAREGSDLIVSFKDGHTLRIENYFAQGTAFNNLVFVQDDGTWLASFDQAMVPGGDQIADAAVAYSPVAQSTSTKALLALLGIAAGAGVIAAVASGGGDGDSGSGGGGSGGGGGGSTSTTPAVAPIGNVIDNSSIQASNNATPVLQGSGATPNGAVHILLDGRPLANLTADANGNWQYTMPRLPDGSHQIVITQTNSDGSTSQPTVIDVLIDTVPPAAPTVGAVSDDAAPVTGSLASGAHTNDATPTLSGTAEAGATITILNGTTVIGTTTADANGNWRFTPSAPLADGTYALSVTATDVAGNVSAATTPFDLVIDTNAPASPVVQVSNGNEMSGTAEAGSVLALDLDGDGNADATVTADGSGHWSYTPGTTLPDGSVVIIVATDAAGNAAAPVSVTIDSAPPQAPVLSPSNGTTLAGTAEPGSTVNIDLNGDGVPDGSVVADGSGNWSFTPATPVAAGTIVSATATDSAGNTGVPGVVTIDGTPPGAVAISGATNDASVPILSGGATSDTTPTLSGTAEANATINVYNGTTLLGTTTANGTGAWTFTPSAPLADGTLTLTATATDAAGNTGPAGAAFTIIVDTSAPTAPTITQGNGTTLAGIAEANASIGIDTDGDGVANATVPADVNGNWTYTAVPPLANGTVVSVTATDAAGNVSAPATVTVDASAPAAPAIDTIVDNVAPVTHALVDGDSTNDATPTLSGTAEPNSIITIYDGATPLGTVTADGNGAWTFTTPALVDGPHALSATATDAAGNTGTASAAIIITVDTIAPPSPVITGASDDNAPVTGPIAANGSTNDNTPTLTGTAAPNAEIAIYDGNTLVGTTTANGTGDWSVTVSTLGDGPHTLTAIATDAAGNASAPGTGFTLTVDTAAPGVPVINASNGDTLTGTAEAGSTVRIDIGNDGSMDITVTADVNGNWSYAPAAPLPDGTVVAVSAADAAGNASTSATLTTDINVGDTTPPAAPIIAPTNGTLLTGTAEAGSTVNLDLNNDGVADATATVDGLGNWSYAPPTPLPNGTVVSVTATDRAGNTGPATTTTVDLTAPAAPVIDSVTDNVAPVTGTVAAGGSTNDSTPTLAGTAEANSTIEVFNGSTSLGTVTADSNGNWRFTPTTGLPDGTYTLTAVATDALGNAGVASAPVTFTVDTAAPGVPTVNASQGNALGGTADPGSTVNIDLDGNGTFDATATADANGNWTYTPATPVAAGTVINVTASDAAGNVSAPASTTIDRSAPAAPLITTAVDDSAPGTGPVGSGGVTNDTTPAFTGTAEPNSTIHLYLGTTLVGTAVADGTGAWSVTPSPAMMDGTYTLTATATDAAGNTSTASGGFTLTIDTTPPEAPTINASNGTTLAGLAEANAIVGLDLDNNGTIDTTVTANGAGNWTYTVPGAPLANGTVVGVSATDAAGNVSGTTTLTIDGTAPPTPSIGAVTDNATPVTGTLTSGASTNDTTPTLSGSAEANSTVEIFNGSALLGTVTADASGNWTFTPVPPLTSGTYSFTVTATDAAGNASGPSAAFGLVIDTAPPPLPVVAASNGSTITGTAEANSTIGIDLDGDGVADATVATDGTGNWTYTPAPALADGTVVSVTATDAAGNTSGAVSVTVDAAAPLAPAIVSATDDTAPVTGTLGNGGATNDTTPTLSGTAEPNSTVEIFNGTTSLGTANADGNGAWTFTPGTALPDGTYTLTATATDAVGNTGPASAVFTLTVDTATPAVPVITASNGTTIAGTADAGSIIQIDLNGDGTGDTSVTADADGNWRYDASPALANGITINVTASDAAGNTSAPAAVTIDALAPTVPVIDTITDNAAPGVGVLVSGAATNDTTPTLAGTAEPNAVINLYDGTTLVGTVTANGVGAWTFTPAALSDGTYSLTITATDAAGNTSNASAPFVLTIDTILPNAPVITGVSNDASGTPLPIGAGAATNDATPVIAGIAEPNASIQIFNGAALVGTTFADADGNWSFTPATALPDATYVLTAVATDAAGNAGPASASFTVTVDTAAPGVPTIAATDGTSLSGTAEAGGSVSIDLNGDGVADATVGVDGNGNWSYLPATRLPDNAVVSVTARDAAGNTGNAATATVDYDIFDTTPPAVPTIAATNGTTLGGSAEAGSFVDIDLNNDGVVDTTVQASATGTWAYTPATPLANGTVVTVTARDANNNVSAPASATVDAAAPLAPSIVSVIDNVAPVAGTVPAGGSTNDSTPTLSGTAEANSVVNLYSGATLLGTVTADGAGNWTFTPTTPLADATYTVTATATDAVGNTSTASTGYAFTVDTLAPGLPTVAASNGAVLSGTAEAGSTVGLDLNGDGTADVTVTATPGGTWTYAPATPLGNGVVVNVTATDAAGNVSNAASTTIDAAAPGVPVLGSVTDNVAPVVGTLVSGAFTNDTTPTLTGTAEAGSTVSILDGTNLLGTVVADGSGNWTFTTAALGPGAHALTITATDAVGNVSTATAPFIVNIDTEAPGTPIITRSSGTALTGTAAAGAFVNIDLNGDGTPDATVTADGSGNWSFSPSPALGNGVVVSVTASDAAGNTSAAATATVDALAPAAPVITSVTDNVAPVLGTIVAGGSTNDTTPTLNGTAEAGASIAIFSGAALLATVVADGAGNWSYTPPALGNGTYALSVTATDAAGNVSAPSPTFTLTVDTVAPTATPTITALNNDTGTVGDWVTGDHSPIVSGTLSATLGSGEALQLSLDGGATWTNAVVSGTTWDWYPAGQLADGSHTLNTRVIDAAGNIGATGSQAISIVTNVAPQVAVRDAEGLLGIADANLLGLIEIGQQQFFAASDYNNNIQQVQLSYGGVVNLLSLETLNANQALATELGLRFAVVNNPGLLGIGASSVLTITSLDGGPIDNLHLNELLGSVTLSSALLGINVGLLNSLSISATDTTGLTSTTNAGQLLSAGVLSNLLGPTQPSAIITGTTSGDTLNGSAGDDRIYGYSGDDTLNGGGGNDLLRGGAGNDVLNGGAGNDLLIGGAGNDRMTGGAGGDVFLWEVNTPADNTGGNGADTITDFSVGTSPNQAGLDRLDVLALLVGYQSDADGPAHYVNGVARIDAGDNIANYLSVTNVNGNTVITIDRDGAGGAYAPQTLVTLNNVTTNLETLLANHQILV